MPEEKLGAWSIGQCVSRDFGDEGIFTGTITAYRRDGDNDIYELEYEDGDHEELATEEYQSGRALWMKHSGCEPPKSAAPCDSKPRTKTKPTKLSKAARDRIGEVIDLTAASTIAGKHLKNMSDSLKESVIDTAVKNHKKMENNNVKTAVLEVQYAALCHATFVEHLKAKVTPASQMLHGRRQTIIEEQGLLARIKVGDWVFATEDMSPGMNSEGGYGCVTAGNFKEKTGDQEPVLANVDVHWLISNRHERHVCLDRLTVVAMPYKDAKPSLRARKEPKSQQVVTKLPPPLRTQIEWLEFGVQTRKHERKGWLKEELVEKHKLIPDTKAALWSRILADYACTEVAREGMRKVLGDKYVDPREYKGVQGKETGGRFMSLKKESQIGIPKNIWTLGFLMYAYDVEG